MLQILKEEVNAEADIEGDQKDSKSDVNDTVETNETDVHTLADKDDGDAKDDKDVISKPAADHASEDGKHDEKQQQQEDEEKDEEPARQPDRGEIRSRILKEQYEKFVQMVGGGSAIQKVEGEASDAESSTAADAVPLADQDMAKLPKFLQVVAKERAIRLKRFGNDG